LGDVQIHGATTPGEFRRQLIGIFAPDEDAEPDVVLGRLVQEGSRNCLSKTAVRAGD